MAEELSTSEIKQIKIVPYPKVIFFWPTLVLSLLIGMMVHTGLLPDKEISGGNNGAVVVEDSGDNQGAVVSDKKVLKGNRTLGLIWVIVFALNLCVVAFEFNRIKFLATIMAVVMLILAAFLANTQLQGTFFVMLGTLIRKINIQANHTFYYAISTMMSIIFLLVYISTRWNYWVVEHNMILHYKGFMGDVHRYPAPNLRMSKEITDIFEYFLGLSGTLILQPSNETRAIVLENVIGINRKEERIKRLLGSLQVSIRH